MPSAIDIRAAQDELRRDSFDPDPIGPSPKPAVAKPSANQVLPPSEQATAAPRKQPQGSTAPFFLDARLPWGENAPPAAPVQPPPVPEQPLPPRPAPPSAIVAAIGDRGPGPSDTPGDDSSLMTSHHNDNDSRQHSALEQDEFSGAVRGDGSAVTHTGLHSSVIDTSRRHSGSAAAATPAGPPNSGFSVPLPRANGRRERKAAGSPGCSLQRVLAPGRFAHDDVEREFLRFSVSTQAFSNSVIGMLQLLTHTALLGGALSDGGFGSTLADASMCMSMTSHLVIMIVSLVAYRSLAAHRRAPDEAAEGRAIDADHTRLRAVRMIVAVAVTHWIVQTFIFHFAQGHKCPYTPVPRDQIDELCAGNIPDYSTSTLCLSVFQMPIFTDALVSVTVANVAWIVIDTALTPAPWGSRAFGVVLMLVFSASVLVLAYFRERATRAQFESLVAAKIAEKRTVARRADVQRLVECQLPGRVVRRVAHSPPSTRPSDVPAVLGADRSAFADTSIAAGVLWTETVGFRDFETQFVDPSTSAAGLAHLFALFDVGVSVFDVDRGFVIGDAYVATAGLVRPAPGAPASTPLDLLRFAFWQHELDEARVLALRSGFAVGPASAALLGSARTLRYHVGGKAVACSARLAHAADPATVLLCSAAAARAASYAGCHVAADAAKSGALQQPVFTAVFDPAALQRAHQLRTAASSTGTRTTAVGSPHGVAHSDSPAWVASQSANEHTVEPVTLPLAHQADASDSEPAVSGRSVGANAHLDLDEQLRHQQQGGSVTPGGAESEFAATLLASTEDQQVTYSRRADLLVRDGVAARAGHVAAARQHASSLTASRRRSGSSYHHAAGASHVTSAATSGIGSEPPSHPQQPASSEKASSARSRVSDAQSTTAPPPQQEQHTRTCCDALLLRFADPELEDAFRRRARARLTRRRGLLTAAVGNTVILWTLTVLHFVSVLGTVEWQERGFIVAALLLSCAVLTIATLVVAFMPETVARHVFLAPLALLLLISGWNWAFAFAAASHVRAVPLFLTFAQPIIAANGMLPHVAWPAAFGTIMVTLVAPLLAAYICFPSLLTPSIIFGIVITVWLLVYVSQRLQRAQFAAHHAATQRVNAVRALLRVMLELIDGMVPSHVSRAAGLPRYADDAAALDQVILAFDAPDFFAGDAAAAAASTATESVDATAGPQQQQQQQQHQSQQQQQRENDGQQQPPKKATGQQLLEHHLRRLAAVLRGDHAKHAVDCYPELSVLHISFEYRPEALAQNTYCCNGNGNGNTNHGDSGSSSKVSGCGGLGLAGDLANDAADDDPHAHERRDLLPLAWPHVDDALLAAEIAAAGAAESQHSPQQLRARADAAQERRRRQFGLASLANWSEPGRTLQSRRQRNAKGNGALESDSDTGAVVEGRGAGPAAREDEQDDDDGVEHWAAADPGAFGPRGDGKPWIAVIRAGNNAITIAASGFAPVQASEAPLPDGSLGDAHHDTFGGAATQQHAGLARASCALIAVAASVRKRLREARLPIVAPAALVTEEATGACLGRGTLRYGFLGTAPMQACALGSAAALLGSPPPGVVDACEPWTVPVLATHTFLDRACPPRVFVSGDGAHGSSSRGYHAVRMAAAHAGARLTSDTQVAERCERVESALRLHFGCPITAVPTPPLRATRHMPALRVYSLRPDLAPVADDAAADDGSATVNPLLHLHRRRAPRNPTSDGDTATCVVVDAAGNSATL